MYMNECSWENLLAYKAHTKYIKQQDIKHSLLCYIIEIDLYDLYFI
jgi:hypothetical protein